ncbi:hypothetical protein CWI42_020840 [Ordospora colligata]|uniref:PHD-type domain-containing protein n=1 Tax=Ordospora colligata OC4 TaxID=1354746 RepID=A0A0B2ULS2_9MICR|nr:uncharacterized protein M896_020850 [Ordospora colligata OC4]KHN70248.1 hypothetical protein M896_020850 [Ordospora colligata OC4]TBU16792.1 hypothetical protein CWI41_020860 [Ordospora colligata]TBU16900.1 hypothetical protein CWI40_020860 [Ordospora colligata]TBU19341.1 hypothetical protein CWI42_020840 [Ordospora colligata]
MLNTEDLAMLYCDTCANWLHTVCCGFLSNTDKRIPNGKYTCLICSNHITKVECCNALFRRVISVIYNENFLGRSWLCNRLQINSSRAYKQIQKMINQGLLIATKTPKGTVQYQVVTTHTAKNTIKKHFSISAYPDTQKHSNS